MRRRLFEDLVVSQPAAPRTRQVLTFPVSMAIHAAVLASVVVLPMLSSRRVDAKHDDAPSGTIVFRTESRPQAQQKQAAPARPSARITPIRRHGGTAPPGPAPIVTTQALPSAQEDHDDEPPCLVNCDPGPAVDGQGGPPGPRTGAADGPLSGNPSVVRVSEGVRPPAKLRHVNPVYPEIAKQARVEGVVVLECVIGTGGRVVDVKLLRGIPLLDAAAMDAVRQWVYTPTLLNGTPVAVVMTVTVKFTLG